MPNCPFKIHDYVQTHFLGVGRVKGFHWQPDKNDWKIIVDFRDMRIPMGFNSESIRKATWLEVLLYA